MTRSCINCGAGFEPVAHQTYCSVLCRGAAHRKAETSKPDFPERKSFYQMRDRCNNPNHHAYDRYGGRGIRICERWDAFDNFYADMGKRPSMGHSLDRIDNDGDYSPDNCRWATRTEQSRNRRGVTSPEHDRIIRDGVARGLNFGQIARIIGKSHGAVSTRGYRLGLKSGQPAIQPRDLRMSAQPALSVRSNHETPTNSETQNGR